MPHGIIIHVNDKFARLTVIACLGKDTSAKTLWLCGCDCGRLTSARTAQLSSGLKKSCGCLVSENMHSGNWKHGMTGTPEHRAWNSMKARCHDPNQPAYRCYGAKGITVCQDWRDDFMAFFNHIGPRPSPKHSLDRIDNTKGYEPGNVRWATRIVQSQNRSMTVWITHNGVTRCLAEWARLAGRNEGVIRDRLRRGWTTEQALTIPVIYRSRALPPN